MKDRLSIADHFDDWSSKRPAAEACIDASKQFTEFKRSAKAKKINEDEILLPDEEEFDEMTGESVVDVPLDDETVDKSSFDEGLAKSPVDKQPDQVLDEPVKSPVDVQSDQVLDGKPVVQSPIKVQSNSTFDERPASVQSDWMVEEVLIHELLDEMIEKCVTDLSPIAISLTMM